MRVDGLIKNANIATSEPSLGSAYGLIEGGSLVWTEGKILYVGAHEGTSSFEPDISVDARGRLVTPGFVDCHTHLVFAGDRSSEFESRLQGESYESISRKGGGIVSTVKATRAADFSTLYWQAKSRLQRLFDSGVTTVEIKSGYGLTYEDEMKCLRVINKLKQDLPLTIKATCLAAHMLPPDFEGTHEDYIQWICQSLLPEVKAKGLADAVDIFCESIAFSARHAESLFETAQSLGFAVKGHVEQLSQSHGCDLVCAFSGVSADHLEYANESQIKMMGDKGIPAVLLPGAYYYLAQKQVPPIPLMRKYHVSIAVATDLNPGSSPLYAITSAANMASILFGMTIEESFMGITTHAALALSLDAHKGKLCPGMDADFILWACEDPSQLLYEQPTEKPEKIWLRGQLTQSI